MYENVEELKRRVHSCSTPIMYQLYPTLLAGCYNDNFYNELTLHVTAGLIVDWYLNAPQFKKTLYAYEKDINESDRRMMERYSKKLREINAQIRMSYHEQGIDIPLEEKPKFNQQGIPISKVNIQAITNVSSRNPKTAPLLNALNTGRILHVHKVSNAQFVEYFNLYEEWINELQMVTEDDTFFHNSVDFYLLQERTQIDLIAQVAQYMDENKLKEFPYENSGIFWGELLDTDGTVLSPKQILGLADTIPLVFTPDEQLYKVETEKRYAMRKNQSIIFNQLKGSDVQTELSEKIAADFFRSDYNILAQHKRVDFGTTQTPNRERIRLARNVMGQMLDPSRLEASHNK